MTGLPLVRIHDLKHTFGRRLRAAGVGVETRMVLLGHTNEQITTHYFRGRDGRTDRSGRTRELPAWIDTPIDATEESTCGTFFPGTWGVMQISRIWANEKGYAHITL